MRIPLAHKEAAVVIDVWKWYKNSEDALLTSKQKLLSRVRGGKSLPREFIYKSEREITEQFRQSLKELNYATILGLISAIEAAFRIDHQIRLKEQKEDGISQEFIRLDRIKRKKKGEWTKFGDDILITWKNIASRIEFNNAWTKSSIDKFRNLVIWLNGSLEMRDWIAHGRCFERKGTQKYDPGTIFMVAEKLMHNLPHNNFFGRKYLSA